MTQVDWSHAFYRDVRDGHECALVKCGPRTATFRVSQSLGDQAHTILVKMAYRWINDVKADAAMKPGVQP